jgi:hypothetical protein
MRLRIWCVLLGALVLAQGCNECTGTLDCRVDPEISYSGQVIDRATRRGAGGVNIAFTRDSGMRLAVDTVRAQSDADGNFVLRASALAQGPVHGHLRVSGGSAATYTIPVVSLHTSRTRGDGGYIGRIVTKPFFRLIGFVRDRKTLAAVEGATVFWQRMGGGTLSRDTITFTTAAGGAFAWLPDVLDFTAVEARFSITAPGYPRTFVIDRKLELQYFDNDLSIQYLPLGIGFPQFAVTGRRGSGQPLAGTTVQLTRVAGIPTQPEQVTVVPTEFGAFGFPLEPAAPGTTFVRVNINPPAPFTPESRIVPLVTSDDDIHRNIGFLGVGAAAYFGAELRDETGALIPEETTIRIRRVSGLPLLSPPTFPDGDHRITDRHGRFEYGTPTADSGTIIFDITVRHEPPFVWDTIRNVTVQSRYSDSLINLGTLVLPRRKQP